jgi:transcriptional regulator with XRE-family HTH domain
MDLKTLAGRSGVSASYLSRLEAGKRGIPTLPVLVRLARGLDTPLHDLLHLAGVDIEMPLEANEPAPFGLPSAVRGALERAVGVFSPDDWRDLAAYLSDRVAARTR